MRKLLQKSGRSLWTRLRLTDTMTLVGLILTMIGGWCFLEIAEIVSKGRIQSLDNWVVHSFRHPSNPSDPIGPPWLDEVIRDLSALGGTTNLVLVIGVASGYLWISRAYHSMWLVLSASLGGLLLSTLLKSIFQRPRPSLKAYLSYVPNSSFPSGHTMNSAVVYLTLGLILAQLSERNRLKSYFLAVGSLLTLLVGLSRVYLGAHYPSDILAGWSAGSTWAVICWLTARHFRQTGSIESIK